MIAKLLVRFAGPVTAGLLAALLALSGWSAWTIRGLERDLATAKAEVAEGVTHSATASSVALSRKIEIEAAVREAATAEKEAARWRSAYSAKVKREISDAPGEYDRPAGPLWDRAFDAIGRLRDDAAARADDPLGRGERQR